MEEKVNEYVLKQFDSLAHLKHVLDGVLMDLHDGYPEDYMKINFEAAYQYRCDYLRVNNLIMNNEEKALWRSFGYQLPK